MTSGPSLHGRLAALSLAMLLPSLGTSIANVSLPSLAASFGAQFHDVQWVVIGYLLAVTTLIVGAGRLGDIFGRRVPLLIGIGLFMLASAACALAPDIWILVLMRGVQGAGAALMMSLTMASVGDMVPRERTGSVIGLLGTVSAAGTALGPTLGGALISAFGWPAIFVFLAGAALLALLFGYWMFPREAPAERQPFGFDLAGTGLLVLALGAYALATTAGVSVSATSAAIFAGVSLAGLGAFVVAERRARAPLVQLELLGDRRLSAALLALGLVSAIIMSTLVVGPFYLGPGLGLSPVATGLVMSVGPAVAALVGAPAGRLVDRFGSRKVAIAGLVGVVVGSSLMTLLPVLWGAVAYAGSLAVITAGYALFQAANNTAIMARAPGQQKGLVSGLLGLSRNLGLTTGASVMGSVFAAGARGLPAMGLPRGPEAGMHATFAVAALAGLLALALSLRGSAE